MHAPIGKMGQQNVKDESSLDERQLALIKQATMSFFVH